MKNYSKTHVLNEKRTELHDRLNLTGAEISINRLAAGTGVPFVHAHKNNEEIYFVMTGKGHVIIDDEKIDLIAGDWIRIAPKGKRQFFASQNEGMSYICIQVHEHSLQGYSATDGILY